MTEGCQHATHQLGEDDRVQREKQLVPLDNEERHQCVAATLQRGETKADCCAQDHAVTDVEAVDAESHHHDEHALDELLDQPDFERADEAGADQPVLEQRGTEHPHDAADKEGGDDSPWRKRRTGVVIQVPDDRRNGHQKTAEKDDGGQQNDVAGDARHDDGRPPQHETSEEDRPPWRRPALRRFLRLDLHLSPSVSPLAPVPPRTSAPRRH